MLDLALDGRVGEGVNLKKATGMKCSLVFLVVALAASAAFAHNGVTNPAVMARMHAMSAVSDQMKVLGMMVKHANVFDKEATRTAAAEIAKHAAATPVLFEAPEDDPKSEAKNAIWTSFDDFTAKANEMEKVATQLSQSIETFNDLSPAVIALGKTCEACHSVYRK